MKKNILILILAVSCVFSILFTGCIDETKQTNVVTEEELQSSLKATEALMWGLPAFSNRTNILASSVAYDWGYGSIMHIRDVMGDDLAVTSSGYDWYSSWAGNQVMGESYMVTQYSWTYLYRYVLAANKMISKINTEIAPDEQLGYLGIGYAFRAFIYLDLARMYEFLENDKTNSTNTAGNNVLNLTVPIVTDTLSEASSRKNPRVTRQKMYEFILSDLEAAEAYIQKLQRPSKTVPDISVVYGLRARLYMWMEDYTNARIYARKAIDAGNYVPLSKDEWLHASSGFNDAKSKSWMWGSTMEKEDAAVVSKLWNWTSWKSNETSFGYTQYGAWAMIDARTYSKISNDDFRKLSWKAPASSPLSGQMVYVDAAIGAKIVTYASVKFRPGLGNTSVHTIGAACGYPLMRVEEMYLIEAEAAAQAAPATGIALLETFMKTYRYASYTCLVSSKDDVINEIIFQKRIELWGEGLNYFDYKRLNIPVTRGYAGTNVPSSRRFNTATRPAWMNFCIVRSEKNANPALLGYENPDPSDLYKPWTP